MCLKIVVAQIVADGVLDRGDGLRLTRVDVRPFAVRNVCRSIFLLGEEYAQAIGSYLVFLRTCVARLGSWFGLGIGIWACND